MIPYRSEIDGLRAVAVVPVILFHAKFAAFSGGFVGVDVFFVISGYLITSLVLAELERGRFSFRRFYERRIRRLAPALILVVLATVPPALLLMTPTQLKDYAQSVVAVALLASNVLFWIQSGYFVPSAEMKPLLHTWSLAVEEQFYLLFPLLLVLTWRRAPGRVVLMMLGLGVLSVAAMVVLLRVNPTGNFFLAPSRFWELIAGALCAGRTLRLPPAAAEAASGLGLAMIAVSVALFDETTPFPSAWTLLPVAGTVLVILCAGQAPRVRALLSLRPLVWIGLISYSAYLWHQPLFAFARLASLEPPGPAAYLALIAATLLLAHLTWRWVERPFRHPPPGSWAASPPRLWAGYVAASAALIAFGLAGHVSRGFPDRLSAEARAILAWLDHAPTRRTPDPCFINTETGTVDTLRDRCLGGGPAVFLIGDSHAQALTQGLQDVAGLSWMTGSACPPIRGYAAGTKPACGPLNALTYATIATHRPGVVIIHAHWSHYMTPTLVEALAGSLDWIAATSPQTRIVLIGSIPKWYPSLPEAIVARRATLVSDLSLPLNVNHLRRLDARLAALVAGRPAVTFVSLIDTFCDDVRCRATVGPAGSVVPVVWDNAHLTREGALFVRTGVLDPLLAPVRAAADGGN